MKKNIWKSGIMGVVVGDALGCPVQFEPREEVARHPITGMRGYGAFNVPEGSWTDDSSLTIALLDSLVRKKDVDLNDIMENFMKWLYEGEFTPYGYAYDIGNGTQIAIHTYHRDADPYTCGSDRLSNNGNGSLMRILPACLFCHEKQQEGLMTDTEAVETIHQIGGLTHGHLRAKIACGLYYFMVREVLAGEGTLRDAIRSGLEKGFNFYEEYLKGRDELEYYARLRDIDAFAALDASEIRGSGYVVEALEAAIWSLLQEDAFDRALLVAVNLGEDTDTVAAIAGGLAGLYYGHEKIPAEWLEAIQRREWIEELCDKADEET